MKHYTSFALFYRQYTVGGDQGFFSTRVSPLTFGDKDSDGLTDDREFNLGANPCEPDTDYDGQNDGSDCAPLDALIFPGSPELCDAIDDQCPGDAGYGTIDESCPYSDDDAGLANSEEAALGADPNDPDTDDDGLTDGREVNTYSTDPLDKDTDNDGVSDGREVKKGTNPLKKPKPQDDGGDDGSGGCQASINPSRPGHIAGWLPLFIPLAFALLLRRRPSP
jgi:hypothetical protein